LFQTEDAMTAETATTSPELRDFRLMVRNAEHNLELVKQVLRSGARLIEQVDIDRAARQAASLALTPAEPVDSESGEALTTVDPGGAAQARTLMRLSALPATAKLTTEEAAVYLNCSTSLLRSWRWQGRGPKHEGTGKLVRYTKGNLDKFMVVAA
jgi:hypothetical protein